MKTPFISMTKALKELKDYSECHLTSQGGSQGMVSQVICMKI